MLLALRDTTDLAAALHRLGSAAAYAVDGATAEDMARGCALLDIVEDGRAVGAVAVELLGSHAFVTGAASSGCATWQHLRLLEQMVRGHGARTIGMTTRRRGLVRQLAKLGYQAVRIGERWELGKELA